MRSTVARIANAIARSDAVLLVLGVGLLLVLGGGGLAIAVDDGLSIRVGLIGPAALAAATAFLWLTAHRWSRAMPGAFAVAIVRWLPVAITGRSWVAPYPSGLRVRAILIIAYCAAMAWLWLRFDTENPNRVERIALVVFAVVGSVALFLHRSPRVEPVLWAVALAAVPIALVSRALRPNDPGGFGTWWRSHWGRSPDRTGISL